MFDRKKLEVKGEDARSRHRDLLIKAPKAKPIWDGLTSTYSEFGIQ